MIVVDVSALTAALAYSGTYGHGARTVLARDPAWAAPEHWKAELFSAIRGLTLGKVIGDTEALTIIEEIPRLGIDHVAIDSLLPRMWDMRNQITGYDAAYVALAEAREITLVTADARLARSATPYCRIELLT